MSKKKIGFTCSTFDLLHAGHIAMLKEAKSKCDILIVGLQSDPTLDRPSKNKPVQDLFERWTQLNAVKYVDKVIPYSTEADLINLLTTLSPDIRILGEEYKDREFTGNDLPMEFYFNKRRHNYSSSLLRVKVYEMELSNNKSN